MSRKRRTHSLSLGPRFCRLRYTITLPLLQDCDPGTRNGLLTVLATRRNMVSLIDQEVWIGAGAGQCKEIYRI